MCGLLLGFEWILFRQIEVLFYNFVIVIGSEMWSKGTILQFLFDFFLLILMVLGLILLPPLHILLCLCKMGFTTGSKYVYYLLLLQELELQVPPCGDLEKKGYFMQDYLLVILLQFYSNFITMSAYNHHIFYLIQKNEQFIELLAKSFLIYNIYLMEYKTIGIIVAVLLILYKFFGQKLIFGLLLIAAVLLTLVYFNQNKILYIPLIPGATLSPSQNPMGWRHPSEQGCSTENVQITTLDVVKLRGWLLKSKQSERLIIYFHQNAGNLGHRIQYLKNIHQYTNSDVLIVAYRGFSDSEGLPTQQGLQRDSEAILDWAINYKNSKIVKGQRYKIFVFGRSLGGAVTLYISTKQAYSRQISGVILQNTFTNIKDMISHLFPILAPFTILQRNFWTSSTRIVLIKQPILFIRSLMDQIVPTQQMIQLINSAANAQFKRQYVIPQGTHNMGWQLNPDAYFDQFNGFFQKIESK